MPDDFRIAYLFSRYPVASQTFCDTEMLALERQGVTLEVDAIHPPSNSFRHGCLAQLKAPIYYAPPQSVLKAIEQAARAENRWPAAMVEDHEKRFGAALKPALRCRNALHFARSMKGRGVAHLHVHFANRAAHTALFIKHISGIPFSITAHAQDFMVDIPESLLGELVREAAFVVAVSDFSRNLIAEKFPGYADKIHRVHNGIELQRFRAVNRPPTGTPRILSIGRLVEFKGFHHLLKACADLRDRGLSFSCEIIGDGELKTKLQESIQELDLEQHVQLPGILPQETVAQRLAECDVFALPCDFDSKGACDILPTVILEAMAAARPVVSTRTAGVPEMVEEEKTGLLTDRGDTAAFSRALFRLIADHELRREMGNRGRIKLESTFRVENTSAQLRSLFESYRPASPPQITQHPVHLAYLLSTWPAPGIAGLDAELKTLLSGPTHARAFAILPPRSLPLEKAALAEQIDFLPDAMAIEGIWRQQPHEAQLIENLRDRTGNHVVTESFLAAAHTALAFAPTARALGVRHIHAVGARAILAAWLLKQRHGIPFSVTLPTQISDEIDSLLPFLTDAVGGRCTDAATAKTLGESFRYDPSLNAQISPRKILSRLLQPTPDPSAWLAQLASWSEPS